MRERDDANAQLRDAEASEWRRRLPRPAATLPTREGRRRARSPSPFARSRRGVHGDERDADGLVVPHARDERATRRGRARRRRRERDAVDPRLVRPREERDGRERGGGGARVRVAAEPVGLGPGPQVVLQRGEIPRGQLPVRRPRERDRRGEPRGPRSSATPRTATESAGRVW